MNIRLTIALIIFSMNLFGNDSDHWETIVGTGDSCSYLVPSSDVEASWITVGFDDSGWSGGTGGVGYGDDDDQTHMDPSISVYCRYEFYLADTTMMSGMILDADFDDGFVAYLNGTELARHNMGLSGTPTTWDQAADNYFEAPVKDGKSPMRFILDPTTLDLLVPGMNLFSVEVHNQSPTSSDLSSNFFLHALIATEDTLFKQTPDWFIPPMSLQDIDLPLMKINTGGQNIPDEPRIAAQMTLMSKKPGTENDTLFLYDGQISIETRGESTGNFPKSSYSIEAQTDSGTNNNVSMLGLPEENDFVLYGPYSDKSLIRNAISFQLFELMGQYAPRTRFIELEVNGDYRGLYLLVEKIKRDKNRVDIAKLTPQDTTPLDMSGGYILRIDKTSGMPDHYIWESDIEPPVQGYRKVKYQYFDPKYDELTNFQRSYIRNWLYYFEEKLASPEFMDPVTGYRAYLDISSFTDLMILNEFTKDVDGYRLSHYMYKQRDDQGGKLVQGPTWDYNLTFGNNDFAGDINSTSNWLYTRSMTIYWWARIMQDPWFQNELYCRWDSLYKNILNPDNVSGRIDEIMGVLEGAIERNYQRWPILGVYVYGNYFVGNEYSEEEEFLRDWIDDRLYWLNGQWGGLCVPVSNGDEQVFERPSGLKIYPNPSDLSHTFVKLPFSDAKVIKLMIADIHGRVLFHTEVQISHADHAFLLPDMSHLSEGIYILSINDGNSRLVSRLVKN